ncbi:hypothetical protein AAG906_003469 [Vitis piasezkii]
MQALIENPKAFIILVFPRLASPSLVPDEYFMLKDFHFYKVACLADSEAHQETLRQAPATGRPLSSSTVRPSAYKKKIHVLKRLSESIAINPSHSKKAYSAPAPDSLSKPTPSTTTAFITLGPDEKLPTDMGVLFPTMLRIQIEVDGYPSQSFMAQLSYGGSGVLNLMQRELLSCLEMAMSETVATLKLAEKGDYLLRKVEEEEASHKHVITNNTPSFPFDVEEDELLGGLAQGDGHASRGGPFIGDSSLGERA